MNFFRARGIAVASAKISRARTSPTTRSSSATATTRRVSAGIVGQARLADRLDLAGHHRDHRAGRGQVGGSAATAAICAARLPPAEWPIRANRSTVGPDVPGRGVEDVEGVGHGGQGVGQEVGGPGEGVGLVPREDHDLAAPHQVLDPGAVGARVHREPAVVEDHDRGRSRASARPARTASTTARPSRIPCDGRSCADTHRRRGARPSTARRARAPRTPAGRPRRGGCRSLASVSWL